MKNFMANVELKSSVNSEIALKQQNKNRLRHAYKKLMVSIVDKHYDASARTKRKVKLLLYSRGGGGSTNSSSSSVVSAFALYARGPWIDSHHGRRFVLSII